MMGKSHFQHLLSSALLGFYLLAACQPLQGIQPNPLVTHQALWVRPNNDSSRIGQVDLQTGEIQWHLLDPQLKQEYDIALSADRRYLASSHLSGVSVYKIPNPDSLVGPYVKVAELKGYSQPQWSINTLELLLLPTTLGPAAIWHPNDGDQPLEKVLTDRKVCSAVWSESARYIYASVCLGERELIKWDRRIQSSLGSVAFNLKLPDNRYALYGRLGLRSQNHQQVLVNLYSWGHDVQNDSFPAGLSGHIPSALSMGKPGLAVFSSIYFVAPSFGDWVNDYTLISAGQTKPASPKQFDYAVTDLKVEETRFILNDDPNCLVDLVVVGHEPILKYVPCEGGDLVGFYRLDIQTGNRIRIPLHEDYRALIFIKPSV